MIKQNNTEKPSTNCLFTDELTEAKRLSKRLSGYVEYNVYDWRGAVKVPEYLLYWYVVCTKEQFQIFCDTFGTR